MKDVYCETHAREPGFLAISGREPACPLCREDAENLLGVSDADLLSSGTEGLDLVERAFQRAADRVRR